MILLRSQSAEKRNVHHTASLLKYCCFCSGSLVSKPLKISWNHEIEGKSFFCILYVVESYSFVNSIISDKIIFVVFTRFFRGVRPFHVFLFDHFVPVFSDQTAIKWIGCRQMKKAKYLKNYKEMGGLLQIRTTNNGMGSLACWNSSGINFNLQGTEFQRGDEESLRCIMLITYLSAF